MFARNDTSIAGKWWWTIDKAILIAALLLISVGTLLITTASPAVASKIGLNSSYFIKWHCLYAVVGIGIMVCISLIEIEQIKLIAILAVVLLILLLMSIPFSGHEYKGARRWISVMGFSMQPSELLRPFFVTFSAYFLTKWHLTKKNSALVVSLSSLIIVCGLLINQPDLGMCILTIVTWLLQLFLLGYPIIWFVISAIIGVLMLISAYFLFPHVAQRIDRFLFGNLQDKWGQDYQIFQSYEAINKGNWFGVGPGEGLIKRNIPDAHADFIFAVAAEEFGIIFCTIIIVLFTIMVLRAIRSAMVERDLFVSLTCTGIAFQVGLQAFINIASSIGLLPTKGITLPFISYGGSSMLATCLGIGIVLSCTKRRFDSYNYPNNYNYQTVSH